MEESTRSGWAWERAAVELVTTGYDTGSLICSRWRGALTSIFTLDHRAG